MKVFLVLGLFLSSFNVTATPGSPETRAVMQSIFVNLSQILPDSFDEGTYAKKETSQRLQQMLQSTKKLGHLSTKYSHDFHDLSDNLEHDINQSIHFFNNKKYRQSAFFVQNLTENCFACHSKYPENKKIPTPNSFYSRVHFKSMSQHDQAKLYVITRQFELAKNTLEAYFTDPKSDFTSLDTSVVDYLGVSIGILNDFASPQNCFKKMISVKKLDDSDHHLVKSWLDDLKTLEKERKLPIKNMKEIAAIIAKAKEKTDFIYDQRGYVYWTFIRSKLYQLALTSKVPNEKAEVYYWLGVSSSIFDRGYWVSQTQFYLESAIRLTEDNELAMKAYKLMEQNINLEFSGSGGTHIPEKDLENLKRFKSLASQKKSSAAKNL